MTKKSLKMEDIFFDKMIETYIFLCSRHGGVQRSGILAPFIFNREAR